MSGVKLDFSTLYPSIGVDRPYPMSKLECSLIKKFNHHIRTLPLLQKLLKLINNQVYQSYFKSFVSQELMKLRLKLTRPSMMNTDFDGDDDRAYMFAQNGGYFEYALRQIRNNSNVTNQMSEQCKNRSFRKGFNIQSVWPKGVGMSLTPSISQMVNLIDDTKNPKVAYIECEKNLAKRISCKDLGIKMLYANGN